MDRYLSPSRTAPSTQMSLLSFAPHFTRTNHSPAKRPAPVPAKHGPGRPRKRPRPVDVDDRFVHTCYASMEKEIQEDYSPHPHNIPAAELHALRGREDILMDGSCQILQRRLHRLFSSKPLSSNKVSSFTYGLKTIRSSRVLLVRYASVRCI